MDAVDYDSIVTIARLPGIAPDTLEFLERAMLDLDQQEGVVSLRRLRDEMEGRITSERLESCFFALVQAGVLKRIQQSRKGHIYDQYHLDADRASQVIRDSVLIKHVMPMLSSREMSHNTETGLIATLPDNLSVDIDFRRSIPNLAASLHRLIVGAKHEIIILNPFFERSGFERLSSALLAAASRGVVVTVITRELNSTASINHQVLSELHKEALGRGLEDRFHFYNYQLIESGRVVQTSHAKVLTSDEESAYIGSANLTEYGMSRFVEIGIVLKGEMIKDIRRLLQAIIGSDITVRVDLNDNQI